MTRNRWNGRVAISLRGSRPEVWSAESEVHRSEHCHRQDEQRQEGRKRDDNGLGHGRWAIPVGFQEERARQHCHDCRKVPEVDECQRSAAQGCQRSLGPMSPQPGQLQRSGRTVDVERGSHRQEEEWDGKDMGVQVSQQETEGRELGNGVVQR